MLTQTQDVPVPKRPRPKTQPTQAARRPSSPLIARNRPAIPTRPAGQKPIGLKESVVSTPATKALSRRRASRICLISGVSSLVLFGVGVLVGIVMAGSNL